MWGRRPTLPGAREARGLGRCARAAGNEPADLVYHGGAPRTQTREVAIFPNRTHSLRPLLAATLALSAAMAGADAVAQVAPAATEVGLDCPAGTTRRVRHLERARIDRELALSGASKEVSCADAEGRAEGPAVHVQRVYRYSTRALMQRKQFSTRDLVLTGGYQAGLRHGSWVQYGRNGAVLGDNALHRGTGTWKTWHDNGRVAAQGRLVADKRVGDWQFWFGDGQPAAEGQYRAGARHGLWRRWYADGGLREVAHYQDGTLHGLRTTWHPDGDKHEEGNYAQGKRDGDWTFWSRTGDLLGVNHLTRGTGHWIEWHEDGGKREEGALVDDRREGHWVRWDARGQKKAEGDYERGAVIASTWIYYEVDGRPSARRPPGIGVIGRLGAGGGIAGAGGLGIRGSGGASGSGTARLRPGAGGAVSGPRARGGGGVSIFSSGALRLGGLVKGSLSQFSSSRFTNLSGPGGGKLAVSFQIKLPPGVTASNPGMDQVHGQTAACVQAWRQRSGAQGGAPRPKLVSSHTATAVLPLAPPRQISGIQWIRRAPAYDAPWHQCMEVALSALPLGGGATTPGVIEVQVRAW